MKQTIEIEVPEGKKAVWKDGRVMFEDIISNTLDEQLPKTWDEFCQQNEMRKGDCFISEDSEPVVIEKGIGMRDENFDRNILPSEEAAKAHLALMQLHQLRDCYRQGWEPDWDDNSIKSGIKWNHSSPIKNTELEVVSRIYQPLFLSFPTYDLANEFLTNFRDLIEQAWDLI